MNKLPYAEDVAYFQTSKSDVDTWLDRTKKMIKEIGGIVRREAFAIEDKTACYLLHFSIGPDNYEIMWPVLPSRAGKQKAAQVQAVTLMYHDVKARCVTAMVFGIRTAFLPFLLLPGGKTAAQVTTPELATGLPRIVFGLPAPAGSDSDVVDGEYK